MTGYIHPQIEHLAEPIASLNHYHLNPRQHAKPVIIDSLRTNGQYRPVVGNIGTHTGRPREILAGNGTMDGALDLGWEHLAVTWVDVDEQRAARIVLVDNRANDLAAYDDRLLVELLETLGDDFDGTGFDPVDVEALVAGLDTPDLDDLSGDGGADEDLWPAVRIKVPSAVVTAWRNYVEAHGGNEARLFAELIGYDGEWT